MKSTLIKVMASMLAIMMCVVSFAACGGSGNTETTTAGSEATTTAGSEATTTTASEKATTTETTKATETTTETTTESTTEAPPPATVADGLIVYYEDFNSYANSTDTAAVLSTIKWTKLTKEANGVYNETDGEFAIEDGRLYFDNYDAETIEGDTRVRGKDGYYQIDLLNDAYMKPIVDGKYTLQYDMVYTDAGKFDRYAVIVTECSSDGMCYNSFHFRISGMANHQCHFFDGWKTYSAYDPATDLNPATKKNDGSEGTNLGRKLMGIDYSDELNFKDVQLTFKLQWEPGVGHDVFMKTSTMTDFVQVSEVNANSDGAMYVGWEGYAVQFKFGAKIDGYLDNIVIWTGHGEQPTGTAITYTPAA